MEDKQLKKVNNQLVVQSRRLVEARYNFSLWELRLYIKMIEMVQKGDEDFRSYRIYFKDLIKDYGGNSNRDYQLIQKSVTRLLKKLVTLEYVENGKEVILQTHLLSSAKHPKDWRKDDDNAYLELSFDPHLKPYLLNLKGNFLLYDRQNILKLQSKFSVRIYQILKSHERKESDSIVVEYSVIELRKMLLVDDDGNPTKQYKDYYTFKKRVILQAQKELQEHTDIAFSFDEIKKGRRVDMIRFFVRKNRKKKDKKEQALQSEIPVKQTPKKQPTTEAPDLNDPILQREELQRLIDIGVTPSAAMELVKSYDSELILYTIKKADQENANKKLTNFPGFVVKMLKNGDYQKELDQQKTKQSQKKQEAEAKAIREENDRQIRALEKQFEEERKEKVSKIVATLEAEQQQTIIAYARQKFGHFLKKKDNEEVLSSYFFMIAGAEYLTENGEMTMKESDFYEWIEATHKVKIQKNGDLFEVVS